MTEGRESSALVDVILEFNEAFPGSARFAREVFLRRFLNSETVPLDVRTQAGARLGNIELSPGRVETPLLALDSGEAFDFAPQDRVDVWKSLQTEAYAFARLASATVVALAAVKSVFPAPETAVHLVHKIWRDHPVEGFVYESVRTIKCDAARAAFGSAGLGIVWAVADTGVDQAHPHFHSHDNLNLPSGLRHCDFTASHVDDDAAETAALTDTAGHGTHVAGIIAGAVYTAQSPHLKPAIQTVNAITVHHTVRTDDDGAQTRQMTETDRSEVSGIAPLTKLLSLRVLSDARSGLVSNLLAAIGYIQRVNNYGRDIKVHGINLSLGYPFNPAWFAAGQSPLCVEVDRLVRCGVCVVAAAGNAGYGRVTNVTGNSEAAALTCTICDPGNAELAITVGSTHRDKPHLFGISYFSSKGPTADGRLKPDLVAPGERIVSCTAGAGAADYHEDSGTSMAAPHVSAAAAAFLSARREFIGRPTELKAILVRSAMSLSRCPEFQGAGLVDVMKVLQSV